MCCLESVRESACASVFATTNSTPSSSFSIMLLTALPPALMLVMLNLNYEYAMVLFRDETGRQLFGGALVLQFVGALVIRKIINIKV